MPPIEAVRRRSLSGLEVLVRYLWLPLVEAGTGRVVVGSGTEDGWHDLHTFAAFPSAAHPRLLVSHGGRRAMGRMLTSHHRLRSPAARAGRAAAGVVSMATGVPWARHTVTVQARDPERARDLEPLSRMEAVLGRPLLAVLGVRQGANGKATLQLFDDSGAAQGYAKIGWSPLTNSYVLTETEVLRSTPALSTAVQTPLVLADGVLEPDRPFLLTQPLPHSARTLEREDDLSFRELTNLFPILRHGPPGQTHQHRGVLDRLARAQASSMRDDELHGAALDLARLLGSVDTPLPVLTRWHGDLVPWNAARDDSGTLWLWDWESSEADAVAGLDIMHWYLNTGAGHAVKDEATGIRVAADRAATHFQALGMGPLQRAVVGAAYSLAKAERYWSLAAAHGSWDRNRVGRTESLRIIATGRDLLDAGAAARG